MTENWDDICDEEKSFDAALIKVSNGIKQIIDTEGNQFYGSCLVDEAIVNEIILPYLQINLPYHGRFGGRVMRGTWVLAFQEQRFPAQRARWHFCPCPRAAASSADPFRRDRNQD
jgi:hypothetical protein